MQKLIEQFNSLKVDGMPPVIKLYGKKGDSLNIECKLPNGESAKILDDNKMYYFAELQKADSERFFGVVTDKRQLVIFEYSSDFADAELIIWKRI